MESHSMVMFLLNGEVSFDSELKHLDRYPFDAESCERFLKAFGAMTFDFDGPVRHLYIHSAKENLPRHSYAEGFLYDQWWEDLPSNAKPVASIHLECGGDGRPIIDVHDLRSSDIHTRIK